MYIRVPFLCNCVHGYGKGMVSRQYFSVSLSVSISLCFYHQLTRQDGKACLYVLCIVHGANSPRRVGLPTYGTEQYHVLLHVVCLFTLSLFCKSIGPGKKHVDHRNIYPPFPKT